VVAAACVVGWPGWAPAETGAPVLDYPLGVRSEGMGQTGTADAWDPQNLYFNPAHVAGVEGGYAAGSYMLLFPRDTNDVHFNNEALGTGYTFGGRMPIRVAAGVTIAHLSYGTVTITDINGDPLRTDESEERAVAFTAGARATVGGRAHVSLGLAFKRWTAHYVEVVYQPVGFKMDRSASMFDVGTVVSTDAEAGDWRVQPALGVAWVNLGSDIDAGLREDPLPSRFQYGVSTRVVGPDVVLGSASVPAVSATLNIDGIHGLSGQDPTWGFGTELAFMDAVFLRWGRRVDDREREPFSAWGVGLGLPLGHLRARLEYANIDEMRDKFGATVVWLFGGAD